jgi:hypothetical protein
MIYGGWDEQQEELEMLKEELRARHFSKCCNCGDEDGVCCSNSEGAWCGPCWNEMQSEKKARKLGAGPR